MRQFSVRVAVIHPFDAARTAEVELVVDTGATLSCVPRHVIEKLGVPSLQRRSFRLRDGRTIERDTVAVVLRIEENETYGTVVVGEPGDVCLLGLTTLQMLGLGVDLVRNQLVPEPLLAM